MIPWIHLGTAPVPEGGEELRLWRRGAEFSIRLGAAELMNSRLSGSEEALATLPIARLGGRPRPRLLIGGLGMGFTLRAALAALGPDAEVVVAELVPAVVEWARGPMAELFGDSLADPRTIIQVADVASLIRAEPAAYDAILLDVDNGPEGMSRQGNDGLYTISGLSASRRALRKGGVLAVWSQGPDKSFTHRVRHSGFSVEEVMVRANGKNGGGAKHIIWLATAAPKRTA